jgi:SAM-dependent methyltransferase
MTNDTLAYPPPELLIQITNENNLETFIGSFPLYRDLITGALERAGKPLAGIGDILDFGSGAGRLYYAFRDHLTSKQTISGCDLNDRAVAWSRSLGYKSFVQNTARGPIDFAADSFDLVVAVSVFTHLEIALQHHWVAELHRILRPGGCLFMSVHGTSWVQKLIEIYTTHPHAKTLEVAYLGGDALFVDLRFSGGADDDPQGQREVAIAHTEAAVKSIFQGFHVAIHDTQTPMAGHDVYLLVKLGGESAIGQPPDK